MIMATNLLFLKTRNSWFRNEPWDKLCHSLAEPWRYKSNEIFISASVRDEQLWEERRTIGMIQTGSSNLFFYPFSIYYPMDLEKVVGTIS